MRKDLSYIWKRFNAKNKKKTEEEKMVLVEWVSDGFFNEKKKKIVLYLVKLSLFLLFFIEPSLSVSGKILKINDA